MTPALIIRKVGLTVLAVFIFLLPFFFLTTTPDFYDFNKQALLIGTSLLCLLLLALEFVAQRQVRLIFSPFGLPLLSLVTVFVVSTFLKSPNRLDSLLEPGLTGTLLSLIILFTCAINFIRTKTELDHLVTTLVVSVTLFGLITILWTSGTAQKIPFISSIQYLNSATWSPAGSPISGLVFLLTTLPFLILLLVQEKTLHLKSGLLAISFILVLVATGITSYQLFLSPNSASKPVFLSHATGWAIALESLKISPLIGTGPDTFFTNFTRFRPVSYNLSLNWALRFTTSSNQYLQVLSTLGLVGILAYGFLAYRIYTALVKSVKSASPLPLASLVSAAAIMLTYFFLPGTFLQFVFLVIFLVLAVVSLKISGSSLITESHIDIVAASQTHTSPFLPFLLLGLTLILTLPSGYFVAKAYLAELLFQKSLTFAAVNDGKSTYDTLIKTIATNPYRDSYRIAYSQTNLLLANALASQKDLTDTDRNTITQLVQQAIREAKNAVALNPLKVTNLENLAGVYKNLLNFAQGADAWTIASYQQAIALDPVNPNLRIALGGVFYAQKNWSDAIRLFQSAVDLKPNLANAHYNLAAAYREKADFIPAAASMQKALDLLDKSSADYAKAASELAELQKKVGVPASSVESPASALTQPEPLPTPKVTPPLQLDESLSPQSPSTPAASPQP